MYKPTVTNIKGGKGFLASEDRKPKANRGKTLCRRFWKARKTLTEVGLG